jgi:transcriptional regulator with XRE-family HTH domain
MSAQPIYSMQVIKRAKMIIEFLGRGAQQQLADFVGVSKQHASFWLNGKYVPRYDAMIEITQWCDAKELLISGDVKQDRAYRKFKRERK